MKIHHLAFLLLFLSSFAFDQALQLSKSNPLPDSNKKRSRAVAANIIFKSEDGGQTWQDISEGLPENLPEDGIARDGFLANDKGIYLRVGNGMYFSKPNSNAPFWEKEDSPENLRGIVAGRVEADGVLLATSRTGIIRSTDGGGNWVKVINEGGVGIAVERIKGGFAAITYNTETDTRRVRASYNGGKTWQPIDNDLPPSRLIASITEVGQHLFCGHPAGIYRSSDKGKTWQLLLPAIQDKVFNLTVSGNVIYAIPRSGGC